MTRLTARDWERLADRYHARRQTRREEERAAAADAPATGAQLDKIRELRAALGEGIEEALPELRLDATVELDRLSAIKQRALANG